MPNQHDDRKIASIILAAQTAALQLVLEGVMSLGQEVHFQLHFAEFANRLYRDGRLEIGDGQEVVLDNDLVTQYATSSQKMVEEGEQIAADIRKKMGEVAAQLNNGNEQTNKEEPNDDLSPRRTLN